MTSTLRAEFQANGPANVPEFGTVKDVKGFKNLLAMDGYQQIKEGVVYPPVMITTGLNDARVDPWQASKLAARLQATGTPNPVLLRIEEQGGHIDVSKSQADELNADIAAFIFWRAGRPAWQPNLSKRSSNER